MAGIDCYTLRAFLRNDLHPDAFLLVAFGQSGNHYLLSASPRLPGDQAYWILVDSGTQGFLSDQWVRNDIEDGVTFTVDMSRDPFRVLLEKANEQLATRPDQPLDLWIDVDSNNFVIDNSSQRERLPLGREYNPDDLGPIAEFTDTSLVDFNGSNPADVPVSDESALIDADKADIAALVDEFWAKYAHLTDQTARELKEECLCLFLRLEREAIGYAAQAVDQFPGYTMEARAQWVRNQLGPTLIPPSCMNQAGRRPFDCIRETISTEIGDRIPDAFVAAALNLAPPEPEPEPEPAQPEPWTATAVFQEVW